MLVMSNEVDTSLDMNNELRTALEARFSSFGFRHSFVIRHSDFVIPSKSMSRNKT
jgi:hypothetical protein